MGTLYAKIQNFIQLSDKNISLIILTSEASRHLCVELDAREHKMKVLIIMAHILPVDLSERLNYHGPHIYRR